MKKEEWKPIKGWEEFYIINKKGEIKSLRTGKLIIGDINNIGYYRVTLYKNNFKKRYFRHRLVAEHFLVKIKGKDFVNHKDGNKSHNYLENLEWVNQNENERHAMKNGLKRKNKPFIIEYANGKKEKFDFLIDFHNKTGIDCSTCRNWLTKKYKPEERFKIKKAYYC